jgi:hypothetical protein
VNTFSDRSPELTLLPMKSSSKEVATLIGYKKKKIHQRVLDAAFAFSFKFIVQRFFEQQIFLSEQAGVAFTQTAKASFAVEKAGALKPGYALSAPNHEIHG